MRDSFKSVLNCFCQVFPKHFSPLVYARKYLLEQCSRAANLLFDIPENVLIVICDSTYLRHEKSANNIYQRKSFSVQKNTPLCKPFTISTTNVFIIDLPGPFEGTFNDTQILVIQDPHGISTILKESDVFILDRGFRDVKEFLEEKGFKLLMPAMKGK